MTAPNVLLAGAARSGTTALASYLGQHPSIQVAAHKEPHFLAFWPDPRTGERRGSLRFFNALAPGRRTLRDTGRW